jgi:alcohol dehydrogenase YqhD (iron-dependent ADH family)
MEIYEMFIRHTIENYINNQEETSISEAAKNKLVKTLLEDDEFLNDLDFLVIDKVEGILFGKTKED